MPVAKFTKPEAPVFEKLNGDFPFEVVGVDFGLSTSQKTNGCDTMELKLKFFKDDSFAEPVSQWTERLIFHEDTMWKINQFALCANLQVDGRLIGENDEVEYNEHAVIGLRGWAKCAQRKGFKDPSKEFNSVQIFYTDKPKLAKHVTVADESDFN